MRWCRCCGKKNCLKLWVRQDDPRIFEFDALTLQVNVNPLREFFDDEYHLHTDGYPAGPRPMPGGLSFFGPGATSGVGYFRVNSNAVRMHWLLDWSPETHTISTDHIPEDPQTITPRGLLIDFGEAAQNPCVVTGSANKTYHNLTRVGVNRGVDVIFDDPQYDFLINGGIVGDSEWVVTGMPTRSSDLNAGPDEPWIFDSVAVMPGSITAGTSSRFGIIHDTREEVQVVFSGTHPVLGVKSRTATFYKDYNSVIGPDPIRLDAFPLSEVVDRNTLQQPIIAPEIGGGNGFSGFADRYPGEDAWRLCRGRTAAPVSEVPDIYEFQQSPSVYSDFAMALLSNTPLLPDPAGSLGPILSDHFYVRPSAYEPIPYLYAVPVVGRTETIQSGFAVGTRFENGIFTASASVPDPVSVSSGATKLDIQIKRPDAADYNVNTGHVLQDNYIARVTPTAIFPPDAESAVGVMPPSQDVGGVPVKFQQTYISSFESIEGWHVTANWSGDINGPGGTVAGPFDTPEEAELAAVAIHGPVDSEGKNAAGLHWRFYVDDYRMWMHADLSAAFGDLNFTEELKSAYVDYTIVEVDHPQNVPFTMGRVDRPLGFRRFGPSNAGAQDSPPVQAVGVNISGGPGSNQFVSSVPFPLIARHARPTFLGELDADVRFLHNNLGYGEYGIEQHLNFGIGSATAISESVDWESAVQARGLLRRSGEMTVDLEMVDPPGELARTREYLVSAGSGHDNVVPRSRLALVADPLGEFDNTSTESTTVEVLYSPDSITASSE